MGALKQMAKTFRADEQVLSPGIYSARHNSGCLGNKEVALLAGEAFPRCQSCGDKVQYQLLRHAPYLNDDDDFRKP
jgi:hypothetical protein